MSPALDAPCLSREARAAQMTLEVLQHLAAFAARDQNNPLDARRPGDLSITIPLNLCRKAQMALELVARKP